VIGILGGTIYYIISRGMVYIPLLRGNGSACIGAIKAFFITKLPYKLPFKLAFKKCK